MHAVRIGTCGWSYKDWAGVFYEKGLAAGDYLTAYAERYPTDAACRNPKRSS
jgi:uncharacterized protein YecE (DUF72 family)